MLRVLFQTNPAKFRVSKVGFDAGTDSSDNMLIDTTLINLKIITSGRIQINPSNNPVIMLGITLPSNAAVMFQTSDNTTYTLLPFQKTGFQGVALTCTPGTDRITFHNLGALAKWVVYVVVAMTLPA